jgi:hypothetical protein
MLGVRAQKPAPEDPFDEPERPSTVEAIKAADTLTAELAKRNAELAEAKRALEATTRAREAELERVKLEAAARERTEKFDAVAYFTRFQVIALKILLPIAAVAGAVGVTLGIYSKTAIEPKVDRTVQQQVAQEKSTDTVEGRLLALEKYARTHARWAACMNAERDSALERGTGHRTESDHEDVQWVEQNAPRPVPRVLWKTPPWSIATDKKQGCGAEPAPPSTPPTPAPP